MLTFQPSHPYFDEASEYITLLVGLGSTLPLKASNEDVVKLTETINTLLLNRNAVVSGRMELKTVPRKMTIYGGRDSDIITVYGCDNVFEYITGQSPKLSKVRFSVRKNPLKPLPSPGTGQTRVTGADVLSSLKFVTASLLGGAFERKKSVIETKFGSNTGHWPPELQFFYHIRNGCFHGNTFNIPPKRKGSPRIDPTNPPKWHLYTMPSDKVMNSQAVVGGFFPHNQLLPFLHRIGNMI